MSRLSDTIDALNALAQTTLPTYKDWLDHYKKIGSLNKGDLPVTMILNPSVEPQLTTLNEEEEFTTLEMLILRKPDEALSLRTDTEAMVDAIKDSGTLTDTVDRIVSVSRQYEELQTNESMAVIEIQTARVV